MSHLERVRFTCCVLLLTLATYGCRPIGHIGAFATASESLVNNATQAYAVVEQSTAQRRLYDAASDGTIGVNDQTFEPLFSGDTAKRMDLRFALLRKLADYSAALRALATADLRSDIESASADLYGSLAGLRDTYEAASGEAIGLTDADLGLVAAAVSGIGQAIAENQRQRAIRKVVILADPAVQTAVTLIAKDLGHQSDLALVTMASLDNALGSLQQTYNSERTQATSTFSSRLRRLEECRDARKAVDAAPGFFRSVSAGTQQIGRAHAALTAAARDTSLDSAEFATAVGELVEYAKSVKAFHDKLVPRSSGQPG